MSHSTITGEAFSYSRWELIEEPTTEQCADWGTLKHSALNEVSPSSPSPQSSENLVEEEEIVRASEDGGHQGNRSSRHNSNEAHMNSQETVACVQDLHRFKPNGSPSAERGKWTLFPIPNQEASSNRQLLTEKKNQSSPTESHRVEKPHLRVSLMPRIDGQYKKNSMIFL